MSTEERPEPIIEEKSSPTVFELGETLIRAREGKNLTVEDIADFLKLRPRQIAALELGEFDKLPGMTYVRGIIRNYAKMVDLDPEPLLAMVSAAQEPVDNLAPNCVQGAGFETSHPESSAFKSVASWRPNKILIIFAGILVLIALIVHFLPEEWMNGATDAVKAVPEQVGEWFNKLKFTKEEPQPEEPAPEPQEEAATEPAHSPVEFPKSAPTLMSSVIPDEEQNSLMGKVVPSPRPTNQARLTFDFKEDAWIEVREKRSKKVIASGLNLAGTQQQLIGTLPIELKIGNASAVDLTFNGMQVGLGPYTQNGVARLLLQ